MTGASVAAPFGSLIRPSTDKLGDLLFQNGNEGGANRLPHLLLHEGMEGDLGHLTIEFRLSILVTGSHGVAVDFHLQWLRRYFAVGAKLALQGFQPPAPDNMLKSQRRRYTSTRTCPEDRS
jgi:hypothetical protein